MRIIADRDVCVGAGQCALIAETLFDQDDDGVVVVLVELLQPADEARARRAVSLCPSGAIRVQESSDG